MARINDGTLKDWLDGQVVKSNEYKQEREILRTAINDNDAKNNTNTSEIEATKTRVTTLEVNDSTNQAAISSLEGRMDSVEDINATQDTNIADLQTRMESAESTNTSQSGELTSLDGRMTASETKNSEQDERLDSIEQKNTEQDTGISELGSRLNAVEGVNTTQTNRLDNHDSTLAAYDTRISNNEGAINNRYTKAETYNKTEVNSFFGTSSGDEVVQARLGADGTAHPLLKNRLDKMEGYLTENAKQSQTLVHGVQVVNATQNSPVDFEIQGRTLVNNSMSNLLPSSYYVLADKKLKVRAEGKEGTLISGVAKFQKSNSVLTKADFTSKVSGSVTENPHKFYRSNIGLVNPITLVNSVEQMDNRIVTLDGSSCPTSYLGSNLQAQQLFSFNLIEQIERKMGRIPASDVAGKVQWIKDNVNILRFNWHGFGSSVGGNGSHTAIWDKTALQWYNQASYDHANGTVTKSYIGVSSLTNFVDSNGIINFLAYANPSDGTTASQINTDFVELEIELKTTAVLDTRPILTRIANYEGKVSASTVENPHKAFRKNGSTLQTPSAFAVEHSAGAYENINKLDGTTYSYPVLANTEMAQMLFSFDLIQEVERNIGRIPKSTVADKVQWLKDNVLTVLGNWHGFGSSVGGNKASLTIWRVDATAWNSTILTTTQSTVSKLAYKYSSPSLVIDVNGFVHFLAYAEASDGTTASTINTDYVELEIELKQGATLFEPVAPIYEVPVEDYNNILVSWDEANVLNRYPKVQGVQHIQNLAVIAEGENLLPPFTEWTLHANAKVLSPYELELNATANFQDSPIVLNALPNTTYSIYCNTPVNGYITVWEKDINGNTVANLSGNKTFTTKPNTVSIRVFVGSTTTGKFTFTQPMLTLGSTAKPFTPRNPSYLFAPTKLGQIGTVKDTLFKSDGVWVKRKLIEKDVVLDGGLTWIFTLDSTGYKQVRANELTTGLYFHNPIVIKYNGMKLEPTTSTPTKVDQVTMSTNYSSLTHVTVSDTDSGWGETYTPSSADIQRYFNGWKYSDGVTWTSLTGNGQTATASTALSTKPTDYTPYKLSYVLATPQMLNLNNLVEGDIAVSGTTQVEVTSGVVVREKVVPVQYAGADYYINNKPVGSSSYLKNKTNYIFGVYKNNIIDNLWVKTTNHINGNGGAWAYVLKNNYDTTAEYTVTYLTLDRHLFTNNATEVKAFYESNLKGVVDTTVEKLTDNTVSISVHAQLLSDILKRLKAGGL